MAHLPEMDSDRVSEGATIYLREQKSFKKRPGSAPEEVHGAPIKGAARNPSGQSRQNESVVRLAEFVCLTPLTPGGTPRFPCLSLSLNAVHEGRIDLLGWPPPQEGVDTSCFAASGYRVMTVITMSDDAQIVILKGNEVFGDCSIDSQWTWKIRCRAKRCQ